MRKLRVGSLFAGIGGFDLGFERAGMEIAWSCDIEPFAQHILKKHWPDAPVYSDIKELKGGEVEPVDVLCGGFPCQDISSAGKGAGIKEGTRSGLWSEYARLVGELRPRWVVIENVAALRRRGLDRVLGDLSLLGYDAEWDRIRASDVGAPHQRARLWIVAYPRPADAGATAQRSAEPKLGAVADSERRLEHGELDGRTPQDTSDWRSFRPHADGLRAGVADADEVGRDRRPRIFGPARWPESQDGGEDVADTVERTDVEGVARPDQWDIQSWVEAGRHRDPWATEPDVGRVAHGVPARVDRLRSLGNALVPQIAQWIGERIVAYEADLRPGSQSG